jgi:hypothetical protein
MRSSADQWRASEALAGGPQPTHRLPSGAELLGALLSHSIHHLHDCTVLYMLQYLGKWRSASLSQKCMVTFFMAAPAGRHCIREQLRTESAARRPRHGRGPSSLIIGVDATMQHPPLSLKWPPHRPAATLSSFPLVAAAPMHATGNEPLTYAASCHQQCGTWWNGVLKKWGAFNTWTTA